LKPLTFLAVSGAYSYLDPKDFTFQTSNHRYNLRLQTFFDLLNNPFTASVNYKYTGDGYFFDFEQRPFDAFVLIDASISYSLSDKYKLTLFGENLTDKNYRLWHYAWMPGRTFTIQFETSF
jgi:outer membrane receptor protein involved in Fe transport